MRVVIFLAAAFYLFVGLLHLFLMAGCAVNGPTYVEGTRFRMGVYVPWDGQLYGLQVVEYLNGACVQSPSNCTMSVTREFSSTNDYVGITHTRDASSTTVEVR